MTQTQQKLLDLMTAGWTAVIYNDDPRTRYIPPDRHPAGVLRGNSHTVLSLLSRGLIVVAKAYTNNGRVESVEYKLAPQGKPLIELL